MLLCRFRTSWRFSKLLCKYGGAVNVGTVKKNYKINRANAPKCHFFMEEVHHHIKDITSLHQTWTSEEIEKWWDIWCGCKWAQWEFGSYFGSNRCFFLCVLSYLQDCNYWFFTFCLKKNQIFLTTTWVFGVRFGTVHLAQMSFDPDCVKCTYRAAVLLLHASVPGILSARVQVCTSDWKHGMRMNADVSVRLQGCSILSALLKAFWRWNDSIKGTMSTPSPAMWQRFTLTRFPKLGFSFTGGKWALLLFFSSSGRSLCWQERPQRHMTWHALQSRLRALYL